MTELIMCIIGVVLFVMVMSCILGVAACMLSSQISRVDSISEYHRKIKEWADAFDKDAIHQTQEEFDEIYNDAYVESMHQEQGE